MTERCTCFSRDRRSWCQLSMAASILMILVAVTVLMASAGPADARPSSAKSLWKEPYALTPSAAAVAAANKGQPSKVCEPDHLTVYRVIAHTFWNERLFPKHFPQWRPPAQWTKLVGRSHDKSYVLFRLGQPASEGLKIFAESGRSDALDAQSQGEGGVYDEFNAPPVTSGEGRTEAEFFVDGNHSRVSLISKMVPSPDWFIGIDSFNLCVNGKWLDGITIEVDTLDAGTDNGFTFTSPNWPTEPQGVVYRLTHNYPNHPASSFYYPGIKKLPTVATFQFIKVKEYELSEVFHHNEESLANEILKMEHISYVYEEGEGNTLVLKKNASTTRTTSTTSTTPPTTTTTTAEPPAAKKVVTTDVPHQQTRNVVDADAERHQSTTVTERNEIDTGPLPVLPPARTTELTAPADLDEDPFVKNIVDIYSTKKHVKNPPKGTASGEHRHHKIAGGKKSKPRKDVRKIRPPRDCQVSEWSQWSTCSKSCDIGESTRTRKVLHHARRGGQPCPPLLEKKWCGSARSCNRRYFNWSK